MQKTEITNKLIEYIDKWVAVDSNYSKIIASGDSISEVEKKLEETTYNLDALIITYIAPPDKFLSPHGKSNI